MLKAVWLVHVVVVVVICHSKSLVLHRQPTEYKVTDVSQTFQAMIPVLLCATKTSI